MVFKNSICNSILRIKGDTVNVGWVPGTADNDTIASIVEKVTPYL